MESRNRPLSPHLQVYQLPLTGVISILHRITGTILAIGLLFFVYSFYAISSGIESYMALQNFVNNTWIVIGLILLSYALFFHFCHGIRHLIWDTGASFDKETMNKYALIELISAISLTVFSLIYL
jgi:succinate dehydrogenase / fumarate reductase cytochrome b subunit